ncbi:phosphoesterase [Virgibacillus profundi]|uniref:Phosphoesterase n=1 Tax=Virgibacillus profundi TaxID=2024555 RepID=A0A2A2IEN7_9BACI|nr:metallophosphoesterase [Virgibacillus profundi]PAV29714.1 phosphoesterase [Virgibacillus profundi]PXY54011.1 metallophosphoesterase [Virgibacillus profundi]
MKKKTKKKWLYFLIGIALLIYFFYFQNNSIVTSEYNIRSDKLPPNFNGYKIVQLSDLHNKSFGNNQSDLVKKVKKTEPDSIVFTGDLIDSERYDEKPSLILMEKLVQIAPVYYVTGNHEWRSGKFSSLEGKLENIGIQVLRNTAEEITLGTDKIQIIGIDDPAVDESSAEKAATEENIKNSIEGIERGDNFHILLSHRPEMFSLYSEYGFDVIFSGHAHGGQFRIPFVGGLIAPDQGLFPKYTSGKHKSANSTMIVNRGLGNSIIPLRIFNRPEIIVVTLKTDK